MRRRTLLASLVFTGLLSACGGSPPITGAGTGTDSDGARDTEHSDETHGLDSTGTPPASCVATRYPLFQEQACGQIAIGDVTADGVPDLVAIGGPSWLADANMQLQLHTFVGGAAGFDAPQIDCCVELSRPHALLLADINGDDRADPVLATDHLGPAGNNGPTFQGVAAGLTGPLGGFLLGNPPGDYSGDTAMHLGVGALFDSAPGLVVAHSTQLAVRRGDTLGWEPVVADGWVMLPTPPHDLAVTDLDSDGRDEVITLHADGLSVWDSPGDGTLVPSALTLAPPFPPSQRLLVAQLDRAGADDLVLDWGTGVAVGLVESGSVDWRSSILSNDQADFVFAHVDDDQRLDAVTVVDGEVLAYFGVGDGSFHPHPAILANGVGTDPSNVLSLAAGDFDGDEIDEVVVCDALGVLVVSSADYVR